jgi:deoxycytidine triphosphate deaminase
MILTGKEIEHRVGTGEIVIEPFDASMCNPNSYNFHLGYKLLVYESSIHNYTNDWGDQRIGSWVELDTRKKSPTREIEIPSDGYVLRPGTLYLGCTVERIGSAKYVPAMAARSSLGRLGLFIFLNSGLGDLGFVGRWTLTLMVIHPLRVYPGDVVGQMIFFETVGEAAQYAGKYQGADGPQASRLHLEPKG